MEQWGFKSVDEEDEGIQHCTHSEMVEGGKMLRLMEEKQDNTKEGDDYISRLPDPILSYILSSLPRKDEVKTSILSSRWRYLWTYNPNLELDPHIMLGTTTGTLLEKGLQDEEGLRMLNSEFANRVGKLLQLHCHPKVHSFKVSYCFDQESSCHLDRWIEFAVGKGVESLEILSYPAYMRKPYSNYKPYCFPSLLLLLQTSSLKHLQLKLCNLECPPNFQGGFNTLTNVDLLQVKLNDTCVNNFFSGCVHLEVLIMRNCTLPTYLKAVGDSCVNLKRLEVVNCSGLGVMVISAPALTSFRYSGIVLQLMLHEVSRLETLFINFPPYITPAEITNFVTTRIPEDLSRLERLFLPSFPEVRLLPAKMASYVNLKELEIEAFSSAPVDLLWIVSTIEALPLLTKLHAMLHPRCHRTREEVRAMRTSGPPHNQLKEVLITGFVPYFYQTELVICLLKKCVALERMTIDPKWRMYSMDWELIHLKDARVWWKGDGEEEQLKEIIHREVSERVVCSRECLKRKNSENYNAMFKVKRKDPGKWVVTKFVKEHNQSTVIPSMHGALFWKSLAFCRCCKDHGWNNDGGGVFPGGIMFISIHGNSASVETNRPLGNTAVVEEDFNTICTTPGHLHVYDVERLPGQRFGI